MKNIVTAEVAIVGIRPLFQHRFSPEALPLEKQERTGVAGNDPDEWRKTCSVDKSGQLFLDSTYAFACFREGGKGIKRGRAGIHKFVASTLQVLDTKLMVDRHFPGWPCEDIFDPIVAPPPDTDSDQPVYLDIRGVVNPSTKARNVRYRIACSLGWKTTFTLRWDKTVVSTNEMNSVAIEAGMLVGIGNGRNIGMGRFEIESFNVQDN